IRIHLQQQPPITLLNCTKGGQYRLRGRDRLGEPMPAGFDATLYSICIAQQAMDPSSRVVCVVEEPGNGEHHVFYSPRSHSMLRQVVGWIQRVQGKSELSDNGAFKIWRS